MATIVIVVLSRGFDLAGDGVVLSLTLKQYFFRVHGLFVDERKEITIRILCY